jgi:nucleoside-diphosphate-sugar epimerase
MRRFLVTGATGAIGIPLVRNLLHNGHEVTVIARSRPNMNETLKKMYGAPVPYIEGDVTEPHCGVRLHELPHKLGTYDAFIHVAGRTQYHERLRADTYHANKGGTENALALAADLEIARFAFISTCYVAGRRAYLSEEDAGTVDDANNPYESSKSEAEALVRKFVGGESIIIRLSTVIGEATTGYIVNAGGYAAFVRGFWAARGKFARYPKNPFWVGVNPESTLNLVTNEWAVDMIRKAVASELDGAVHLAHTQPVRMGWLFDQSVAKLGLPLTYSRIESERTALWRDPAWRKIQETITENIVGYFGPYVTRDTTFAHERVKLIPGYVPPPEITEDVIRAQVEYMTGYLFPKKERVEVAA